MRISLFSFRILVLVLVLASAALLAACTFPESPIDLDNPVALEDDAIPTDDEGQEQGDSEVVEEVPVHPLSLAGQFEPEMILSDLDFPIGWAVAPDGVLFLTEAYTGRIRSIVDWQVLDEPVIQMGDALGVWEQGMLGLALHPDYPIEPYLYLYYSALKDSEFGETSVNRLIKITLQDNTAIDHQVLLDDLAADGYHNGGILLFGPDGKLYVSVGDGHYSESAQNPTSLNGKILRINPDGSVPEDNPFLGFLAYSLGFRNVFGMAFDPISGHLFVTENGPDCCDAINLVKPGQNYGWPHDLSEFPVPYFVPSLLNFPASIAPTQAVFHSGNVLPMGMDLLFGDFINGDLHRVVLGDDNRDQVTFYEVLLNVGAPIIGIFQHIDSHIYFSTPTDLYRLVPRHESAPTVISSRP